MDGVAKVLVTLSGVFLVGLSGAMMVAPSFARRFLSSFASSFRSHVLEQALRFVAGLGFVYAAPEMRFTLVFRAFGWFVVITSVVLLLLPWRLHHRFGRRTIPTALARLKLYAIGTFGLGAFILFATLA